MGTGEAKMNVGRKRIASAKETKGTMIIEETGGK
jgi:hypothetical protein